MFLREVGVNSVKYLKLIKSSSNITFEDVDIDFGTNQKDEVFCESDKNISYLYSNFIHLQQKQLKHCLKTKPR